MKTKVAMIAAILFAITSVTFAQGNMAPRTVDERVQSSMAKLNTLSLTQEQKDKTADVLKNFYTARQKMREDARASGNRPDRSEFQKMNDDRDDQLKAIFNEEQYKKYKDEIEPAMRPQRNRAQGSNI